MKIFFNFIKRILIGIKNFIVDMLTNPNTGDISSKRVNGTELIQCGIVLGFLIVFMPTQPIAIQVFTTMLYTGVSLLGVGTLLENIKIGKNDGDKKDG